MRGQRSSMKSRSVHRVMEFTFRSWMPTSTYQAYWRACWDRGNGWLLGSVRLAANPEAEPRKRLPEPMEDWVDDPGSLLSVNVQESLARPARTATLLYVLDLRSRAGGVLSWRRAWADRKRPWRQAQAKRSKKRSAAAADALLQLDPQCR